MLHLIVIPILLSVVRLDVSSSIPEWSLKGDKFFSITRTSEELSIVCSEDLVPKDLPKNAKVENGWSCLKIAGPLDFSLIGTLASLATPLANAKISIFVMSTYDTDYILVKKENLEKALQILGTFCEISN